MKPYPNKFIARVLSSLVRIFRGELKFKEVLKRFFSMRSAKTIILSSSEYYRSQPSCQIPNLNLLFKRFLGEREYGTFVEIGANDGVSCSNTWGLAERGWTGYMVEPVPDSASACQENHRIHPRVSTHQYAIGELDDIELVFQIAGMLTTANPGLKTEYTNTTWAAPLMKNENLIVKSKKLDTFLLENGIQKSFDVLVVDVEGFERNVFAGFSLKVWAPKMLIVELADTHPDLLSTSIEDAKLGKEIQSLGYVIVFKDSINTVFVREDIWEFGYRSQPD